MKNRAIKNRGFTLVELIVVITILLILGTIALVSVQGYVGSSQDGVRITDLENIEKGLNIFKIKTGSYPMPEGAILTGSINGVALAYKGTIGEAITREINISKSPTDPLLVSVAYPYGTTADRTSYQVSATIGDGSAITQNLLVDGAYAAGRNRAKVNGDYPGYIKFSTGSSSFIANVPSLVYNFTGSVNDLFLDKANVYFVVNKGTNLPYKLDADTDINDKSGDLIVQELRWPTASLMQVDITGVTPTTLPTVFTGSVLASFGDINTVQRAVFGNTTNSAVAGTSVPETMPFSSCTVVKDIVPGTTSGYLGRSIVIGSTLYFAADDGTNGAELWKSDGTEAGTSMLKNINTAAGVGAFTPTASFSNLNGILYFFANDGASGNVPWKSDGTTAGTVRIRDASLGTPGSVTDTSVAFTEMNGSLYYRGTTSANGLEIWKTDGTDAGTHILKDIYPGVTTSNPNSLTNINGTLYFSAKDGTSTGTELWKSDGSSAWTVMVKDINPGTASSTPSGFTELNGLVYFSATDGTNGVELWRTDGSSGGTAMVQNIYSWATGSLPAFLIKYNGMIYFSATDGTSTGTELWRTDGTTTTMFMDINPGPASSTPKSFQVSNGLLYFEALDPTHGRELWRTDGTVGGTFMVMDINPDTAWSNITMSSFTQNGWLYFKARSAANGYETWKTNGTDASMVSDINPGIGDGSSTADIMSLNGWFYTTGDNGTTGTELYKCQ